MSVDIEERRRRWREANARYRLTDKGRAAMSRAGKKTGKERQRRWYAKHLDRVRFVARIDACNRRAKMLGAQVVEWIDGQQIWERDSGRCYLCGHPVEMLKMSVDHVVPISKGGEHSYSNCRLTHATCNRRKYNKILEVAS